MAFAKRNLPGISTLIENLKSTLQASLMPSGAIVWFGNRTTAPSGWVICDGQNGTPNLIGRYPLGATSNIGTVLNSGLPKATLSNVSSITGGGWEGNRGGHYLAVKAGTATPSISFSNTEEATFVRPPSVKLLPCMKL